MNKILVLFAHPVKYKSRINNVLLDSIKGVPGITIHELYNEYPDFHIDVKREQQLLLSHDIIVWQHPFYWYSAPAIIKEWIDLVLEHGFAYGKSGNELKGKSIFNALSAGGSLKAYCEEGYNNYSINQLLLPFQQTAILCGMNYLPPFVVHGSHLLSTNDIADYGNDYKKILIALRDDIFSHEELNSGFYLNGVLDTKS